MVLFSGTMAFAHSGHDHGKAAYSSSSAQIPLHASANDLTPAAKISVGASLDRHAIVFEARDEQTGSNVPCGTGCCCCGGPSNCGMAGGCAVHALSPGHGLLVPATSADSHLLAALPLLTGRDVAGPDRPPNA